MKLKSIALLSIFLFSLVPPTSVNAQVTPRTFDNALSLLYFSEAILTPESELNGSLGSIGVNSPYPNINAEMDTGALLARIIHAKKVQRNDLDANCRLLQSYYQGQGKECEAREVKTFCDQKRGEINAQIGFYHKMRGDRRKAFTKIWHSMKRSSSNFWHRIGPVGRNFLRNMGREAIQIVVSGGSLSGGVLKNLIKQQAKALGRQRIRQVVYKGVQRLLQGQIQIAQATGLDLCAKVDAKDTLQTQPDENQVPRAESGDILTIPFTTNEVIINWPDLFPEKESWHSCGPQLSTFKYDPVPIPFYIDRTNSSIKAKISKSHHDEYAHDGKMLSVSNRSYTLEIDGPFQLEVLGEGRAWKLTGKGTLQVTVEGIVDCHYYEVSAAGDPILREYRLENDQTITEEFSYHISFYTEDQESVSASVHLNHIWDDEGYNHFTLYTSEQIIPFAEIEPIVFSFSD